MQPMRAALVACSAALVACNAISGVDDLAFGGAGGAAASSATQGSGGETSQATVASSTVSASSTSSASSSSSVATASASTSASSGGDPCGNGAKDFGEQCDDGNGDAGDGCSPTCTVECGLPDEVQDPATHHCYRYFAVPDDWATHEAQCEAWRQGAKLAVVRSAAEATFIDTNSPSVPQLWLGGTNGGMGSTFTWLDGEPFDYTPWEANQPNNPTVLACLAFDGGTQFVDIPCATADVSGVCEYPLP